MEIPYSQSDAITLVHHVIQDHADEDYFLGEPARMNKVAWLATLLGWEFPKSYLDFISIHDGIDAGSNVVLSSDQAFDILSLFQEEWHRPAGYWPVGSDGCGDYWVMSVSQQATLPPGTVFFYDHESTEDPTRLTEPFAPDYPSFVSALMRSSCEIEGCDWPETSRDRE